MAYYRRCPFCGAFNDPGETCDCQMDKKVEATSEPPEMTSTKNGFVPVYHEDAKKSSTERRDAWWQRAI